MPRITVNLSTNEILREARVAAADKGKGLAAWGGKLIEDHLEKHRAKAKSGDLMPKKISIQKSKTK